MYNCRKYSNAMIGISSTVKALQRVSGRCEDISGLYEYILKQPPEQCSLRQVSRDGRERPIQRQSVTALSEEKYREIFSIQRWYRITYALCRFYLQRLF